MGASTERPTSYPPNVIYFGQDKETFHIDSTKSADFGNGDAFYIMVAVKDSGIGISHEDQAKLFERFRQATPKTQEKYGGSGLGLFISRKCECRSKLNYWVLLTVPSSMSAARR